MKKLMLLLAMLTMVLAAVAVPALAQDAIINEDVGAKIDPKTGAATANAGGTKAEANCPEGFVEAKAGDIVAKAPCVPAPPPPPPPPPPPAPAPPPPAPAPPAPAPPPAPQKELPKSGGIAGNAALLGLGAGALLVGGGLLVRRIGR